MRPAKRRGPKLGKGRKESQGDKPLKEIIEEAYRVKFAEWAKAWKTFEPPAQAFVARHPVIAEVIELEPWVHPEFYTKVARSGRRRNALEAMGKAGVPSEDWTDLLKPWSKPGAPVKPETRKLAIEVLELRRRNPKLSWQQFANRHCTCKKNEHDSHCMQRIRQAAMKLDLLLQKLHIEF